MRLFGNINERIAQGIDYDSFRTLARDATDEFRKGGDIGGRAVRLTKNGQGIATTRSAGTEGPRADQIASARSVYLDAVEKAFGLNARMKAAEMLAKETGGKPLTSRVILQIDKEIRSELPGQAERFIASQRDVFDRALQDAVVSIANLHPGSRIGFDPLKIEADVIKLLDSKRFAMTSQGLTAAVAQVVAASVTGAEGTKPEDVAKAAASGVEKSAEKAPIPKIHNQAEFVAFFKTLTVTSQYGSVAEDETALDVNGEKKKTFVFNGIVFRSDDRKPNDSTMSKGFTSWNPLTVPKHRTEAMGLGTNVDGKVGSWGTTGKSGVSCARTVAGSIQYLNPGGAFYVIDTTKLPQGEKAWDMQNIAYVNGYMERKTEKVPVEDRRNPFFGDKQEYVEVPLDETKGEVNVSYIPRSAIIGWVIAPNRDFFDGIYFSDERLDTMQRRCGDGDCVIKFNPDYRP